MENGGTIEVPHPLESLDHEVELAVVIGQKARDVDEAAAMDYVGGTCFIGGRIRLVNPALRLKFMQDIVDLVKSTLLLASFVLFPVFE